MIPVGQRRALPRPRLIGEQGRLWIRDAFAGVVLILFMAASFILADSAAHFVTDKARHTPVIISNHR